MKQAAIARPHARLKQERYAHGWSQKELAEQLKVDPKTVSRWERGRIVPYPHNQGKLCALFGKSAVELGFLEEEQAHDHEEWQAGPSLIWIVPHLRNPYFTSREDVLLQLHQALFANRITALTQTLAISGLGGLAKHKLLWSMPIDTPRTMLRSSGSPLRPKRTSSPVFSASQTYWTCRSSRSRAR